MGRNVLNVAEIAVSRPPPCLDRPADFARNHGHDLLSKPSLHELAENPDEDQQRKESEQAGY